MEEIMINIGISSVRVSTATRRQHWRTDKEEKRAPMPRIIWDDGHNTLFNGVLAENCTGYYLATLGFNNGKK